ncbi:MAG: bifunctional adenosylcobinamide kinase/adenosylcobinamide-phosphate guanylyltransferase [Chloroflexi bacterium]|nr:bifunctional adenosylcobinamide kinase/adenosylcobinamide-phosphate guanylyltransferase [Chloroflexota bacterium]
MSDPGPQLILVLGGARSGKSSFAERLARRSERGVAFIATATASDEDMRDRIARHRAGRPHEWHTVEEPLDLAGAVGRAAEVADILLLDCMTLWLGNWLGAHGPRSFDEEPVLSSRYSEEALTEVEGLLTAFASLDARKRLIVVSNEVGLGIVPAYASGVVYRDILGRVNQRLASAASRVYLMIAGLAVDIKRLHEEASL